MRLIDADIFKEYVMKGFRDNESLLKTEEYRDFARRIAESFCRDIDEQPTAYDVNKVVNKLEMSKKTALDLVKLPHFFIKGLQELVGICFDRAIEIVKAGDE